VIAVLVGQGYRPKQCCRILGVAPAGYFVWKRGPVSQAELRRQWLRQVITQAHSASRGTYGYRRVRAELRLGLGIAISGKTVHKLMVEEGSPDCLSGDVARAWSTWPPSRILSSAISP
jgi:hypothetical protein